MRISHNPPVPPPQPPSPSAEILALRSNWKWAYLSHFLFTYNPVLHLEDIQLSELEDDLAAGTSEVIPTVMQRLLTSLTPHDKRLILEDWQQQLRKQSLKRAPHHNLMGTEDEPVNFTSLIMSDKLDLFQSLCEWQFHNPNNLRARMRDDDDYANWRMAPIAYDAKENAYWLMGGNRLWIQYAPPRKRAAKSHKRKQPPANTANDRKSKKRRHVSTTTPTKVPPVNSSTNSKSKISASNLISGRPIRETRLRGQSAASSNRKPRTIGTRVSSRLRGREEEDIWQPIPEEWLSEEPMLNSADVEDDLIGKRKKLETKKSNAIKSLDDVSELTSLSELSDVPEAEEEDEDEADSTDSTPTPKPDFSSISLGEEVWETVCVTLAEWEAFPNRFENATHRAEKAFYKLLRNDLVPMITEVLRVDVRKKVMEEAVVHRKRSSRIAVKESVREAERAEARRKAEAEKEMERHRRWEARARKEEEERIRRENMRSARLRERGRTGSESIDVDIVGIGLENTPTFGFTNGKAPEASATSAVTPVKFVVNSSRSGTQTPKDDEPWELDCEICHRRGMNLDDGQELMCCEKCNKWQHIRCHDQTDFIAGRPRRNWELVDFLCAKCTAKGRNVLQGSLSQHPPPRNNLLPDRHVYSHGTNTTLHNGIGSGPPQLTHKTAMPAKTTPKQTSYEGSPYSNGRTFYPVPHVQTSHPYPTAPLVQYTQQRSQTSTPATSHPGHPTTAVSRSQPIASASVPALYASSPNMYPSHYSGNYRAPQNLTTQPHQQASSSHYRPAIQVVQREAWTQQQTHYSQLASHPAWNGAMHGSDARPYVVPGMSVSQQQQQNGHYHSSSNRLGPPSNHPPSAQH